MKNILLYKIPNLIILELLKKPTSSGELSKKIKAVHCHTYNLLKKFEDNQIVERTKINQKFIYSLTDKGKYFAVRIQDIYYYEEKTQTFK